MILSISVIMKTIVLQIFRFRSNTEYFKYEIIKNSFHLRDIQPSDCNCLLGVFSKLGLRYLLYLQTENDERDMKLNDTYVYVITSPAPWNSIMWSDRRVLVALSEASSPATATEAVPWISSLKVKYLLRYFSSSVKALALPKSSN